MSRPPLSFEVLEARLHRRLDRMGVTVGRIHAVERCFIPMGRPVPRPQRVVGFGSAAAMVHPATGYMLTRVMETAPRLAARIAHGLAHRPDAPDEVADLAWDGVWPVDRRRSFEVFRFGMDVLLDLDSAETRTFFDVFFGIPEPLWLAYLSGRAPGLVVAEAMARVFAKAPFSLELTLMRRFFGRPGWSLLRSLSA